MSKKIKVIQISVGYDNEGNDLSEYLDDKGRVWYQSGHTEQYQYTPPEGGKSQTRSRWVTEWKQLDLPDEPEEK